MATQLSGETRMTRTTRRPWTVSGAQHSAGSTPRPRDPRVTARKVSLP